VQRLRELGWTDGGNITFEVRWAEGRTERYAEIAAEFVRRKVDVIVTSVSCGRCGKAGHVDHPDRVHAGERPSCCWVGCEPCPREHVEVGGLIAYGAYNRDQFRRAADLVDKSLRGAKPGDLPIEQPTKFDLVINLTTAKTLGLDIPAKILALAEEVIE
jgi:ABC-type uncharacterized transport system substrate-binding protein